MSRKNIVIAGGGTGGHIYPGIAIARAVKAQHPDFEIHFVGTAAGLESKIVPREGFPLHLIPVGKLNHAGSLFSKLKTLIGIPRAFIQSISLLMDLKPQAVLGVGGYASGPFVLIASLMGFRTAIWEPNAFPGMTNRWLSRFVRKSFVVFEEAAQFLHSKNISQVGIPIRKEVEALAGGDGISTHQGFRILVFGGSQGARSLNRVVCAAVQRGGDWLQNTQIVHQTGTADFAETVKAYENQSAAKAYEYLYDMEKQYAWADLIVCRSGASTVAEIAACGKPAIFVPLSTAADDHQRKNAETLVNSQAAMMILQKDLTPESLIQKIEELKNGSQQRQEMRKNLTKFYKPQAAAKMAELLLG